MKLRLSLGVLPPFPRFFSTFTLSRESYPLALQVASLKISLQHSFQAWMRPDMVILGSLRTELA